MRIISSRHLIVLSVFALPLLASFAAAAAGALDNIPNMIGMGPQELRRAYANPLQLLTENPNAKFSDWQVWGFPASNNEPRYVVFSWLRNPPSPGASESTVVLLSQNATMLGSWTFLTGYKIRVESAEMSFNTNLNAQLISVTTSKFWGSNGRDVRKEYFALSHDQMYLIRLENSQGRLMQNIYDAGFGTIGPDTPAKGTPALSALLDSPEMVPRLAALTYLSGMHMDPDHPHIDRLSESLEHAKVAQAFRLAPDTAARINEYQKSNFAWLKEAADLAATPAY